MPAISQNELKDQVWKQEPLFEGHKTKNYVVRSNDSAGVGAFPGIPRVDLMLRGKPKPGDIMNVCIPVEDLLSGWERNLKAE